MTRVESGEKYRRDIDGLRAIAVLAVIFFHFGMLPAGYLGVDVFFVISGFLITRIVLNQIDAGRFSIRDFYLRRTRRIIPLSLFIGLVALVVGILCMLPDDLENLSQSVVATNFFGNNVLQAITTGNYWDVVNEFKPLMHTWSLGVEEQYYLLYPFLLLLVATWRPAWLLPVMCILAFASLLLCFLPFFTHAQKFYLIFFRFWELAVGGIVAIVLKNKLVKHGFLGFVILALVALLCVDFQRIPANIRLIGVVMLTAAILATSATGNKLAGLVLGNRLMVGIGKISFSLYMWHQLVLAYARYFWVQELDHFHLSVLFVLICALSITSYFLIEQPFRDKRRIGGRTLLFTVASVFLLTTCAALYIYSKGGVLKDVPELGLLRESAGRNIHARYNERVFVYNKPFVGNEKTKVLIIGNSFARDWGNVLLESKFAGELDISYVEHPDTHPELGARMRAADVIFYSAPSPKEVKRFGVPESKLWAIGTKNYGVSNGVLYNHGKQGYFSQRTSMEKGVMDYNNLLKSQWRDRFIDLIARVIDEKNTVPVFTPSDQFISQDCRHFTNAGARYFSELFEQDLGEIFEKVDKRRQ